MHRMVLPLAVLAFVVAAAPLASAQSVPDPEAAVAVVCGLDPTVRDTLPVCARAEPAAPQAPQEDEHQHEEPGSPQDVPSLATEAADALQDVVEDPASAPGALAGLAATIIQFVKDLLQIPVVGFTTSAEAFTTAVDGVHAAAQAAADGATAAAVATGEAARVAYDAAGQVVSAVAGLFAAPAAEASADATVGNVGGVAGDATSALDQLADQVTDAMGAAAP